jgi:hypothetical protein
LKLKIFEWAKGIAWCLPVDKVSLTLAAGITLSQIPRAESGSVNTANQRLPSPYRGIGNKISLFQSHLHPTLLYTWLDLAHKRLDEAVFAAYSWKNVLSDEEILEKLLALDLERAKRE